MTFKQFTLKCEFLCAMRPESFFGPRGSKAREGPFMSTQKTKILKQRCFVAQHAERCFKQTPL